MGRRSLGRIFVLANPRQKNIEENQSFIDRYRKNAYQSIGKPEPLNGSLSGFWSVRIDEKNRIVFRINEGNVEIVQCGTHYREK